MSRFTLHQGDCREVMRGLPDSSVDAVITDPPYELGFMGKRWDNSGIAFDQEVWRQALRVAKPGAFLLAFGGTRTFHRLACAIEDAGWELRDTILRGHMPQPEDCPWLMAWAFGSGFPKSHNGEWGGTALKPAWEPVIMARKPLAGTVEANWREHGTGALNIDGCRVLIEGEQRAPITGKGGLPARHSEYKARAAGVVAQAHEGGRWPANLVTDGSDEVVALFPREAGAAAPVTGSEASRASVGRVTGERDRVPGPFHADAGSAARFFYAAKASREDRNEGCEHLPRRALNWSSGEQSPGTFQSPNTDRSSANHHPTVKPTALMRYLVRLVTPPPWRSSRPLHGIGQHRQGRHA